ncbi:MAG TPA: alpha-amylase family glycosyl hydrolase, partial [Bradyrhizobium sp.]|nr:alpha-amylase family glycosyl hydrolase [Bradyrhizobium sp.]
MRDWVERAVFWHVYPLGFVGAEHEARPDAPVHHRLRHLIDWLDYAVNLGVSGLLLAPIFASSTHGYDTIDHFRIDPRLGDEADFDALIAAAKAR